jgi:hypothetical protein
MAPLIDVIHLMLECLCTHGFRYGVRHYDPIAGAGVRHAGFAGLANGLNDGVVWAELLKMHGAVLPTAGRTVGGRPTGDPGKIAGVVFWCVGVGGRVIRCRAGRAICGVYRRCGIPRWLRIVIGKPLHLQPRPQKVKYRQANNRHE